MCVHLNIHNVHIYYVNILKVLFCMLLVMINHEAALNTLIIVLFYFFSTKVQTKRLMCECKH